MLKCFADRKNHSVPGDPLARPLLDECRRGKPIIIYIYSQDTSALSKLRVLRVEILYY